MSHTGIILETNNLHLETSWKLLYAIHVNSLSLRPSHFCANSIKHAFPDNQDGIVTFKVETPPEGGLRLICRDNGVGGDEAMRETGENKVDGLGLRLMEASASQVEGVMERGPTKDGYQLELIISPDTPPASD